MCFEPEQLITMTEAGRNFARAARIADENGIAVVTKNNKPKYMIIPVDEGVYNFTHEQQVDIMAKSIMLKYRKAFEELAK